MHNHDHFDVEDLFKRDDDELPPRYVMDVVIAVACAVAALVALALLCRCCRSTKHRGRVLQPAPDPSSTVPVPPGAAPYPQQQYSTLTVAANHMPALYAGGGPYPAVAPYPFPGPQYPLGPHYATEPYPGGRPQAGGMPQPGGPTAPAAVPSAPDAHALPPSYDQVMSTEAKHPPYNPHAPY